MKKSIKIFSIILIAIMLIMAISPIVNANAQDVAQQLTQPNADVNTGDMVQIAQQVIGIINVVAVVVAVVILLVLGIKYMMGSASEKAEYKKSMIPYLVGAFIIFAAPTLVNILVSLFGNFGGSGNVE